MGLAAPRPVGSSWIRGLSTLEPPGKSKMGEMFKQSRKGRKTYFKCLLGSRPLASTLQITQFTLKEILCGLCSL